MKIIQINDDHERLQLIRALMVRRDFLDNVDPKKWDDSDREGTIKDCRAAITRLLKQIKNEPKDKVNEL